MSKLEPKDPKERQIEIQLPETGYPKVMFFNRFRVEREEGFCLVHFGLVSRGGLVFDSYCCVFSYETLEQNKVSLFDYLGKLGEPNRRPPVWQVALSFQKAEVADFINMAFRAEMAETCLSVFSISAGTRLLSSTSALKSQPLVLLRSTAQTQKQLIVALYDE